MKIKYSKKFLKELARIDDNIRLKIEKLVFDEIPGNNPFELGFLEKLQGYDDKYKIRVGSFRIGVTIDKENDTLYFERVVHRREIYRVFP